MVTLLISSSGPGLAPFTLTQSLLSAVHTISREFPRHQSKIFYSDSSTPRTQMSTPHTTSTPHIVTTSTHHTKSVFILVCDAGRVEYCLEFSSISQCLISVTYFCPDHPFSLNVAGAIEERVQYPSMDVIRNLFGDSGKHTDRLKLLYKKLCFSFEEKNGIQKLSKIKVGLTDCIEVPIRYVQLMVDSTTREAVGALVTTPTSGGNKESTNVCFGDHYEDVIGRLGSASEVFYKEHTHSPLTYTLCYTHLGLDVVMNTCSNTVVKIVLHTNAPNHREFCNYSRCFFNISLSNCELCTKDSNDCLLVTPVTNWAVVKSHVNPEQIRTVGKIRQNPSTNTIFPFPDTTLHVLFDHMIFEITSTGDIAMVTLLSHNSHVTHLYEPISQVHQETPFEEIIINHPRPSQPRRDSQEEFYDCLEDSFLSAQSSWNERQRPEVKSPSVHPDLVALMGPNVNYVVRRKCEQVTESLWEPKCLVYQFKDASCAASSSGTVPTSLTGQDESKHTVADDEHTQITTGDINHTNTDQNSSTGTVLYESDTLRILACPLEQSRPQTPLAEDPSEEFEMVSLDDTHSHESDNQSDSRVTPSDVTPHKEPEFVYQPKPTSTTSMVSSRTLNFTQNTTSSQQRKEGRSRLMAHTASSQQRVRGKYKKESSGECLTEEETRKDSVDDYLSTERAVSDVTGSIQSCVEGSPQVGSASKGAVPVQGSPSGVESELHDRGFPKEPPELNMDSTVSNNSLPGDKECQVTIGKIEDQVSSTARLSDSHPNTPPADTHPSGNHGSRSLDDDPPISHKDSQAPRSKGEIVEDSQDVIAGDGDHSEIPANSDTDEEQESRPPESVTPTGLDIPLNSTATTSGMNASADSPHELVHGNVGVARAQWSGGEFVPETGPPSMTKRVVEELIMSEHCEVASALQKKLQAMQKAKELLSSTDCKRTQQLETLLAQEPEMADAIITTLTNSNTWTLSQSAMLLLYVQQMISDSNPRRALLACQAVLCVADNHTTLLLRHKIGRARSLSVPERRQCIKCYVTLEKVDESADALVATLSNRQLTEQENTLLDKLRNVRIALAKIFKNVDLA